MPTDERLLKMLSRLSELTVSEKQKWERVPEREDPDFQTEIGAWTVEIQTVDGDGQAPYRLSIVTDGEEIEWLETTQISSGMAASRKEELRNQNVGLRDLYEAARRQASGANAAMDEINQLLEET